MRKSRMVLGLMLLVFAVSVPVFAQDEPVTTRSAPPDPSLYQLVEVVGGFNHPLLVTHAGDGSGRLFVVEQGGMIWIIQDDNLIKSPFLDISGLVNHSTSEGGLLGLAFHPDYAENGLFFVDYTDSDGNTAVARYQVSADNPNEADPESVAIILTVDQPYSNHNGGNVIFGPDGYLYIGLGDGGSAGDPDHNGQNPHTLLGTILRIDVNADTGYAIPVDNPFADGQDGAPEVWAWGLRNPWRFTFDRATGDLYIGDVGQNQWEEIDFQPADSPGGVNYGWNIYEGNHAYTPADPPADMVLPVAEYSHQSGISVTGGYVYRGQVLPDLQGVYLYADYGMGTIWSLYRDESGTWNSDVFLQPGLVISSFGEDEQGELYVVDYSGRLFRLEAAE
jgi:glucose/arabinose dehydrogenase